jgi:hypothetical protein
MRFLTAYFAVNDGQEVVDWFATYDRASNKSFGGSTRAIGSKISYEKKWAIRLFESKVKITASKVDTCECKQPVHFGAY